MEKRILNKIIITFIIIISVLGITSRIFAGLDDHEHFKTGENTEEYIGTTPEWSGLGENDGIITREGGITKNAVNVVYDDGETEVGSGGGGDLGYGGTWNGSKKFNDKYIVSTPTEFNFDTDKSGNTNVVWVQNLCEYLKVICNQKGKPLTGNKKYVKDIIADGYWAHMTELNIERKGDLAAIELHCMGSSSSESGYSQLSETGLQEIKKGSYWLARTYNIEDANTVINSVAELDKKAEMYTKYFRTSCKYSEKEKIECGTNNLAAKAFILSEAIDSDKHIYNYDDKEKTPVQIAWWKLEKKEEKQKDDENNSDDKEGDKLLDAALDFQNYITNPRLTGGTSIEENITGYRFKGFPIKYDPKFIKTEYTTVFSEEKQQWTIGPFKIDYVHDKDFAFINDMKVYAKLNDNTETVVNKENYSIAIKKAGLPSSANLEKLEENVFPGDNEEFYIILNYDENFRELVNIKVDFQYMNAGGRYSVYSGIYNKVIMNAHIYGEYSTKKLEEAKKFFDNIKNLKTDFRECAIWYEGKYRLISSLTDEEINDIMDKCVRNAVTDNFGQATKQIDIYGARKLEEDAYNALLDQDDMFKYLIEQNYIVWTNYTKEKMEDIVHRYSGIPIEDMTEIDKVKLETAKHLLNFWGFLFNSIPAHTYTIPDPVDFYIWKDLEFKNDDGDDKEAQEQVLSGGAARWWEYTSINLNTNWNSSATIQVKKETDKKIENGTVFHFEVDIIENNEVKRTEKLQIKYRNGGENTAETKPYEWDRNSQNPTYVVREVKINEKEYALDKIEPQTGQLVDGQTAKVTVKNKVTQKTGSLKITKEIEKTKLNTNQYSIIGQEFNLDVTISGECEFRYNGENKVVTKEKSITLPVKIKAVSEEASDAEKAASSWKLENVTWTGNEAPTYEVKESDASSKGADRLQITPEKGKLKNNEPVKIVVKNKFIEFEDNSLGITKTVSDLQTSEVNEGIPIKFTDLIPEKQLSEIAFKFKVNLYSDKDYKIRLKDKAGNDIGEQEVIVNLKRTASETGEGEWEWESVDIPYKYIYGNSPYFTIEETKMCPVHRDNCTQGDKCEYMYMTEFDKTETLKELNKLVEKGVLEQVEITSNNIIRGKIPETQKNTKIPVAVVNSTSVNNMHKGKIVLNKKITEEELIGQSFDFKVKVKGTFIYKGILYKDTTIRLKTDKTAIIDEENNNTDFITIKVDQSKFNTWESEEFWWLGEAPLCTVEENIAGKTITTKDGLVKEIHVSGLPETPKALTEGEKDQDNVYVITFNAENSIDNDNITHSGRIKIKKELENSERCTQEYIDSLTFTFKVRIYKKNELGEIEKDNQIVKLGTEVGKPPRLDEITGKYTWEYESAKYVWKEGEKLYYTIEEPESDIPQNISFVKLDGEGTPNDAQKTISGTLKDSGEKVSPEENGEDESQVKEEDVYTIVNCTNKVEPQKGRLPINKSLTSEGLDLSQFKFKVTLTGKFYYKELKEENYKDSEYVVDLQSGTDGKCETEDIWWYGNAPTYVVEEIESDVAKVDSIQNETGTILAGAGNPTYTPNPVVFVNNPNDVKGTLKITKIMETNGQNPNQEFTFKVIIKKGDKEIYNNQISIKAGETWTSQPIIWKKGEQTPTYTVEEINIPESTNFVNIGETGNSAAEVEGQKVKGTLKEDGEVSVKATNSLKERKGSKFKITKSVMLNKLYDPSELQEKKFTIYIKIEGTNTNLNGQAKKIKEGLYSIELKDGESYESPEIIWYGDKAPTITVTEAEVGDPWKRPHYSNNGDTGLTLVENEIVSTVITNYPNTIMDLTMDLAGKVWEDEAQSSDKNTKESLPNGIANLVEEGIDGVEVYVYRVASGNGKEDRKLAVAHGDIYNSEISFPVITSGGGNWKVTGLPVTGLTAADKSNGYNKVKYDVEFVYDGQTYEPTTLLSYDNDDKYKTGSAKDYIEQTPAERIKKYGNSSLALDYNRDEVNNRIQSVYGKTQIDGSGNTIGTVNGKSGTSDVYYKAEVPVSDSGNRVISKLQTTDNTGVTYNLYKTKARTSTAGLQFPVDNAYKVGYTGCTYTVINETNVPTQHYKALYSHCLHINLGLVRRKNVDIEATKDLHSAKIVVDGKELDYKFNSLSDLIAKQKGDNYTKEINYQELDTTKYKLGLYKTDYYYRAEIYRSNKEVYDNIVNYYKSFSGKLVEDSEIEVYLTYKIGLYNISDPKYIVKINALDDYAENSLGTPVNTEIKKVINGQEKLVANTSYISSENYSVSLPEGARSVTWKTEETKISSSDGLVYNKFKADNLEISLKSGESQHIYVTYAVQKGNMDNVQDCIKLGTKSNIIEIANYSTYYTNGKFAGKIDKDSAPSNININSYNDEKKWYEDDSDAAPVLILNLLQETREINGVAWEDKPGDKAIGDGIRQKEEAVIGGLTTQLIEKIQLPDKNDNNNIKEYELLWPTNEPLNSLGGKSIEYLTGFTSTTETSREPVKDSEGRIIKADNGEILAPAGQYNFIGIPTGNYVVRFLYGNDKTKLENPNHVTLRPAEALTEEGELYGNNSNILTANYDKDKEGATPAVYNGQDYKTTIYQNTDKVNNINDRGYLKNSEHNLESAELAKEKVSDARDSEYKRLDVIANSETITNPNSTIMSTANDLNEDHKKLYEDYSMFADTAKLNLNIEAKEASGLGGVNSTVVQGTVLKGGSISIQKTSTNYKIDNIDVGLIERPETDLVLDKQINEIKLTTNDEKVIFDARYNIEYKQGTKTETKDKVIIKELPNNEYLYVEVELDMENSKGIDQLQALNKIEEKPKNKACDGTQNFRFINVDAEILQGTTIELTYQFTALNVGETDYVGKTLYDKTVYNEDEYKTKGVSIDSSSQVIKSNIKELAQKARKASVANNVNLGEYLGTMYYTGKLAAGNEDKIVKTKVRQVIDYVDNDSVFTQSYNTDNNHMWRNTSITELTGNGYAENRLVNSLVIPEYEILDPKAISYITAQKKNVILSIDNQSQPTATQNSNSTFEKELIPYEKDTTSSKEDYKTQIVLTITKTVSAQDDADNLTFDNIGEIVKFENTVGRRDVITVTGNANPKYGEFITSLRERDTSATELVTFVPPTGIEVNNQITTQVLIVTIGALVIVAVGIVIIKKKMSF